MSTARFVIDWVTQSKVLTKKSASVCSYSFGGEGERQSAKEDSLNRTVQYQLKEAKQLARRCR